MGQIETRASVALKSFGRALLTVAGTEGALAATNLLHNPADWRKIGIGFAIAVGKGVLAYFTAKSVKVTDAPPAH